MKVDIFLKKNIPEPKLTIEAEEMTPQIEAIVFIA